MPRVARAVAVDFPHHVIQRGNNRQKVFFAQETRARYLDLLKEYAAKWDVSILAYCLMTNHVHLLVRPGKEESLAKMMQGVGLSYTQYINKRYKRTGRLWESRFHSCIIDEEPYLWAVARYIERNPKRARIVKEIEDYPYSSAVAHIKGIKDDLLTEELFDEGEREEYLKAIQAEVEESETNLIRQATKTGKPLGGKSFINRMAELLGRDFIIRKTRKQGK